jgi:hypothetical protein
MKPEFEIADRQYFTLDDNGNLILLTKEQADALPVFDRYFVTDVNVAEGVVTLKADNGHGIIE